MPSASRADYESAVNAVRNSDYTRARAACETLAEQGDSLCQVLIGQFHYYGNGVKEDKDRALYWDKQAVPGLRELSEQGIGSATEELAFLHSTGRGGLKQDSTLERQLYEKAVMQHRTAAEQGNSFAQVSIGNLYVADNGVAQDYAEAAKWFKLAAKQEDRAAQHWLGYMRANGVGVKKKKKKAFELFKQAAKQGFTASQYELGVCYQDGIGTKKDPKKAFKWIRRAAKQNLSPAQVILGRLYASGEGTPRDHVEATKWYRKAAEQGESWGQYSLGSAYENGTGVEKDPQQAMQWYRAAAEQGNESAKEKVAELEAHPEKMLKEAEVGLAITYGTYQVIQAFHERSPVLITNREMNRAKKCIKTHEAQVLKEDPRIDTDKLWKIGLRADESGMGAIMQMVVQRVKAEGFTFQNRETAVIAVQNVCLVHDLMELERQSNPNTATVPKKDF
jgi:TPR repeat protein